MVTAASILLDRLCAKCCKILVSFHLHSYSLPFTDISKITSYKLQKKSPFLTYSMKDTAPTRRFTFTMSWTPTTARQDRSSCPHPTYDPPKSPLIFLMLPPSLHFFFYLVKKLFCFPSISRALRPLRSVY